VGVSIGHRDTDNSMRRNTVRCCTESGLLFRDDPERQAAHRNLVEENRIEDIGAPDRPGYGIDLAGPVANVRLRANRIVCTRPGLMAAGIRIGPNVRDVELVANAIEGIGEAIDDRRNR
jgi:hypothetical protein